MAKNEMSPARLRSQHRQVKTREHVATPDERITAMLPPRVRRIAMNRRTARHLFAIEAIHQAAQRAS